MAWDEFERNGIKGFTGDKPLDEFAIALKKIADAYESQFHRKPTLDEVLHSLAKVLCGRPERYLSDPAGIDFFTLNATRDPKLKAEVILDVTRYEAAYTDRTDPGYYVVSERKNPDVDLLKIPQPTVSKRILNCPFEPLVAGISDSAAQTLIIKTLLEDFLKHSYKSKSKQIQFTNTKSGKSWTIPYP